MSASYGNNNDSSNSPTHYSLAGTFSPEDIQDLLGAMVAEHSSSVFHSGDGTDEILGEEGGGGPTTITGTSNNNNNNNNHHRQQQQQQQQYNLPCSRNHRMLMTREDDEEDPEEEEDQQHQHHHVAKHQARSERKRSRERQRRCDVNKQFADLTAVIKKIETEETQDDQTIVRLAFSPANRVDLIARTITHLERLNLTNRRQKQELESLQQQLDQAKKAGEDTAAKLKEVMFNHPPQAKQVRSHHPPVFCFPAGKFD